MNIEELELSTRARNVLINAGVDTVEKMMALTWPDIVRLPQAGRGVAQEITELQGNLRGSTPISYERQLIEAVERVNHLLDKDRALRVTIDRGRLTACRVIV